MVKNKISIVILALSLFIVSCSGTEESSDSSSHDLVETEVVDGFNENKIEDESTIAKDVTAEEFKSLFESGKGTLIDVRTVGEVQSGAIEGSINIDFNGGDFESEIEKLDKNQPVYVYCAAGGRSSSAMNMMKEKGFTEVYNLLGGYSNWSLNN